jgi:hypothetical protein
MKEMKMSNIEVRTTDKFDESCVKVRLSEEKEDVVFFKDWNTFELQNSSFENIWVLIK